MIPTTFDERLGHRLRLVRIARGMNQKQLAQQLNISFQQLQKYEKGKNRIAVSRLMEMTRALTVRLSDLLEGLDASGAAADDAALPWQWSEAEVQLAAAYQDIHEPQTRRLILDLVTLLKSSKH